MTGEQADRELAEIKAMAIAHDAGRVFPPVSPEKAQAVRRLTPGLRDAGGRQDSAA